jgi:hypothetical protein
MPSDGAPGWDAIEDAVRERFACGQEPLHWSTGLLPGQDGPYGISAYPLPGVWFFLTFGLSELFHKESNDADISGWGFELTMRTPRAAGEDQPPQWPLRLLNRLGTYVFSAASPFAAGHRMAPGGAITGADDTRLTALAFTLDPDLESISTPNGSVEFLQVVGITDDELAQMKASSTTAVLEALATQNPKLVTDPSR